MIIQHNLLAMNSNRQLGINTKNMKKTTEKLSSGYRINRAADDAAGLAMSEKMRRQIRGLNQSGENIQDGVGYVQTADGALEEAQGILQRMNELAVQSANGTNTAEDRKYIDGEVQQLKKELDRIFSTTSFNEKPIWVPNEGEMVQIDTDYKPAVTIGQARTIISITNDNCGVLSYGNYTVNAADTGVSVSWTGYDGNSYSTEEIDWDTLKANNYSFEMSDYFGDKTDANNPLYVSGQPVFTHRVSMAVQEDATLEQIKNSLNGTIMESPEWAYMSASFEDSNTDNVMHVSSTALDYGAAYVSKMKGNGAGYDFDRENDDFIKSKNTSSTTGNMTANPAPYTPEANAVSNTGQWKFSFQMEGIGNVTATSSSVSYAAPSDKATDDEGDWWYWYTYANGTKEKRTQINNIVGGTPANIVDALRGDKGTNSPGLLEAADYGGYIDLNFTLNADTAYSSGAVSGTSVGSFSLRVQVEKNDTVDSVLEKINKSLIETTVVDISKGGAGSDYGYIKSPTANSVQIEIPIWGGEKKFFVQGGTEAGQHINIDYDCLNISYLGLKNTNTLTVEDSEKAIEEVKKALQTISGQRSDLGAYQNRLEKAHSVNMNAEENTQSSESVIRDTDMAKAMVEYSGQNILQQAGQAMLAQANQTSQSVMALLGQ